MIIKVKETEYLVCFGIKFVRELDKKYFVQNQTTGVKFGTGVETVVPLLMANDTLTLSEVLYMGTCTDEKRPTQDEVDAYLDQADDIEGVFIEAMEELKKQNATKMVVGRLIEEARKQKEELEKALKEKKK